MKRSRARAIERMAATASEAKVRRLYEEVFGAWPAVSVPLARVRASIVEALREELPVKERKP